jgi:uncharacterized membrane protein YqjE
MNRRDEEPGVIDALGRIAGTLLRTVQTRLELASVELGEARGRLVSTLVTALLAALLFGGSVVALSAWLAVALWDRLGPAVLGWIALGYALIGIGLLLWLRLRMTSEPQLLAHTLTELREDAALLRGGHPPR